MATLADLNNSVDNLVADVEALKAKFPIPTPDFQPVVDRVNAAAADVKALVEQVPSA